MNLLSCNARKNVPLFLLFISISRSNPSCLLIIEGCRQTLWFKTDSLTNLYRTDSDQGTFEQLSAKMWKSCPSNTWTNHSELFNLKSVHHPFPRSSIFRQTTYLYNTYNQKKNHENLWNYLQMYTKMYLKSPFF